MCEGVCERERERERGGGVRVCVCGVGWRGMEWGKGTVVLYSHQIPLISPSDIFPN